MLCLHVPARAMPHTLIGHQYAIAKSHAVHLTTLELCHITGAHERGPPKGHVLDIRPAVSEAASHRHRVLWTEQRPALQVDPARHLKPEVHQMPLSLSCRQ